MIKTIVAIATNVSASFDKRGSHSGSYRLRGSDPHPKNLDMAMMALIMLLLSPDPPTHLDRKNNRPILQARSRCTKGKAGEREKEGGALGQVEVSRHKESSSLFL